MDELQRHPGPVFPRVEAKGASQWRSTSGSTSRASFRLDTTLAHPEKRCSSKSEQVIAGTSLAKRRAILGVADLREQKCHS
jgi:hypothetical protein